MPLALALGAGAGSSLAFAPFNVWPLAILAPAGLMVLWQGATPRRSALLGGGFGVGSFAAGTWWLFISIHVFGSQPIWLSMIAVMLFVAALASYYALLGWLVAKLVPAAWAGGLGGWRRVLVVPALWVLIEWWRGSFQMGFPWLSLGYSQTDTWLAGFAPLVGVYGLSALLLLMASGIAVYGRTRPLVLGTVLAGVWAGGWALARVEWTHPSGPALPVAVLQGAIPQDVKWQIDNRKPTEDLYRRLNDQAVGARLIVWPEAAIPELINLMPRYLADIQVRSHARNADVLMGVLRVDSTGEDTYNSILALSADPQFYNKRHLVPFTEYFPGPAFVAKALKLLDLPYEGFVAGGDHQAPLHAAGLAWAPSICYDDAFGSTQLELAAAADALVNVTNDGWFGRSPARYQHLQIGRMRALEVGRYLVRAGNDGISAIIGPHGGVIAVAPEYQSTVLRGTVVPRRGLSPYIRVGDGPVLLLALGAVLAALLARVVRTPRVR